MQNWKTDADGGYLANDVLSKKIRQIAQPQMKFRQFCRVEPGLGKGKGDTIKFDRVSNVASSGRAITEFETMPETSITVTQGTVTVSEYGNSIPYTGKLEALSEFDVNNIWTKALLDDQKKVLDAAVGAVFKTCKIKYIPTGTAGTPTGTFDTDGTVSTAATRDISWFDIGTIRDYMVSNLYMPFYDDDNYVCIANAGFLRAVKNDATWQEVANYASPQSRLTGEVGKIEKIRFIEESNVMANTLGTTSYKGEAIVFGGDAVIEGLVIPEEIRAKIPTDYGRSKGVAWYAMLGFGEVWNTANAGEARIIHITST